MERRRNADEIIRRFVLDEEILEELARCGDDVVEVIRASVQAILSQDEAVFLSTDPFPQLEMLVDRSHGQMTCIPHTLVERRWRRLYTDAQLLKALLTLKAMDRGETHGQEALDAIRDADKAIIVAGAPGRGRLDALLESIEALQQHVGHVSSLRDPVRTLRRPAIEDLEERTFCDANVQVFDNVPEFYSGSSSLDRPFVVKRGASDWPVFEGKEPEGKSEKDFELHAKWNDASYLRRASGPGRVVPVEIGHDYTSNDWRQAILPWDDFLDRWSEKETPSTEAIHYLAQHDLFLQFPSLRNDIRPIDLIYSAPSAPSYFSSYVAPLDEQGCETALYNVWIGPEGTFTPIHRDPYFNCYVQVVGYKHIWIGSPSLSESAINAIDGKNGSVDLFDSTKPHDLAPHIDALQKLVKEASQSIILAPGDVLFMPPGWHHSLKSLSKSFSVSMWF